MNESNIVPFEPALPVAKDDLQRVHAARALFKEFVKAQMVEGVDFGVIPGTNQQSLYQPGAQKLAQLFGLSVRFADKDKEVNLEKNFAMFSYTAECVHLRSGNVLSQCEGSANSHERKYRTRRNRGAMEETPIGDIMNTLMKMAQKRAYVGAVISATGASDFYTQDIESLEDLQAIKGDVVREAPKRAPVAIDVTGAKSFTDSGVPMHCGKPMMTSKFNESEWYCFTCKTKLPKQTEVEA